MRFGDSTNNTSKYCKIRRSLWCWLKIECTSTKCNLPTVNQSSAVSRSKNSKIVTRYKHL